MQKIRDGRHGKSNCYRKQFHVSKYVFMLMDLVTNVGQNQLNNRQILFMIGSNTVRTIVNLGDCLYWLGDVKCEHVSVSTG